MRLNVELLERRENPADPNPYDPLAPGGGPVSPPPPPPPPPADQVPPPVVW